MSKKQKIIAIAGNPNCGKSALFNALTGSNQYIGNWPGVTVEKKEGEFKVSGVTYKVVDLPGIYSFSAYSDDERAARDYILSGEPDLIVNVVDSTNIERNLYLTTQLLEMKAPVLILLNMIDLAERNGITIDSGFMASTLDSKVLPVSVLNKSDIETVKQAIADQLSSGEIKKPDVKIVYPNEIEDILTAWEGPLSKLGDKVNTDSRWLSLKILEGDEWVIDRAVSEGLLTAENISTSIFGITNILKDTPDILIAEYRYAHITGLVKKTVHKKIDRKSVTDKIDNFVMNKVLGIPFFFLVMYAVFWVSVSFGSVFIDFFDILFGAVFVEGLGILLKSLGAGEWIVTLVAGGIGAGVQTVATFIPVIFFMFLMLSLLEDSGYMSRAAFVMDRFMKVLGLPGKAFVPMIVGFGCTVPAILATRTLESKKDRYLTIYMTPLMSCGARLPVYALFGAAFFGQMAGRIVFSLYMVGVLLAVLTGFLLKKTLFKGEYSQFIMELPPYHTPRMKHIMMHTWNRLKIFIIRAGKVIVFLVVLLSLLNSISTDFKIGETDPQKSLLAKIGISITPLFMPMGIERDNWPAVAGLFSGLFAKESVVGTMNSLYSQIYMAENSGFSGGTDISGAEDKIPDKDNSFSFSGELKAAFLSIAVNLKEIFPQGGRSENKGIAAAEENPEPEYGNSILNHIRDRFTKASAYSFLLFVLIYFPCVAALAAAIREMDAFFGTLLPVYLTVMAWVISTLFYQTVEGHNPVWIAVPLVIITLLFGGLKIIGSSRS